MPGGFKYNADFLLDATDREAFSARFPQFAFAFDDRDLRDIFEPIDRKAAKAKRRGRAYGAAAIGLVTVALVVGSFSPLLHDQAWFRTVLVVAAIAAVIGLVAGAAGVLTANSRDEWLRQRFLCERIRQLHFQTLVGWAPLIIECVRNNNPNDYLSARRSRTEKFRSQVINASAIGLADLLADRSTGEVWLVDVDERPPLEDALSASYFEALRELRLRHQQDFTGFQLLSYWTLRPKSPLQTARLLSGLGAFCALLLLNLGVVGLVFDAATGQLASLTHAAMVSLAIVALAARTLEEGLQVHSDVGRYRTYDAALRRLGEKYRLATDNADRRAVLIELEECCFDEMVGFLKSHHEARFLM